MEKIFNCKSQEANQEKHTFMMIYILKVLNCSLQYKTGAIAIHMLQLFIPGSGYRSTATDMVRKNTELVTSADGKNNLPSTRLKVILNSIIMIFYCGLVVHITHTRAQKWLAVHQRTLQKRCLHMTNTGRSKAVYPLHSCIVIRKSTENG